MFFICHNFLLMLILCKEVVIMDFSIKRQLIANTAFVALFAVVFIAYCIVASSLVAGGDETQSTSAGADQKKVLVIDPGHGGEDGGTIGVNGVLEKDLNLMISDTLCDILRFSGYEVIPTRTEDILLYDRNVDFDGRKKVLDLAARLNIAKSVMPDLFVGIHMNSFPQEKYSGLTVYYSPNHKDSYGAASILHDDVIELLQPENNRALKEAGSNIYLLDRMECPGILIECGFLSNREECEKLSDEEYRQKLSFVIFSSLSSFLEE